jgi:hypothetical protein
MNVVFDWELKFSGGGDQKVPGDRRRSLGEEDRASRDSNVETTSP